jgi:hypothetical protein
MLMDKKLTILLVVAVSATIVIASIALYMILTKESGIAFTPQDYFAIPMYNSTIHFAESGRYGGAYFENNSYSWGYSWEFLYLYLGDSPFGSTYPTSRALTVSAQNCNVTIVSYDQTGDNMGIGSLNYSVVGSGNQTLYFGGTLQNVTVYVDGEFEAQNDGWLTSGYSDRVVVTGAKSNVTIQYTVLIPLPA